jgi:hypothetical protein
VEFFKQLNIFTSPEPCDILYPCGIQNQTSFIPLQSSVMGCLSLSKPYLSLNLSIKQLITSNVIPLGIVDLMVAAWMNGMMLVQVIDIRLNHAMIAEGSKLGLPP